METSVEDRPADRDELALDSNALANERTLLAYVRTSLSCLGAGAAALRFLDEPLTHGLGWFLVAAGVVILPWGVLRFTQYERRLLACRRRMAARRGSAGA